LFIYIINKLKVKSFKYKSNAYRKREPHRESMPSGDSFQAGIFMVYMIMNAAYYRGGSNELIKYLS